MRRLFTIIICAPLLSVTPGQAQARVDFSKSIERILEMSCLECHGATKQKGKLRLDRKENALKPGGVIAQGDASKSELYRRVTLQDDDDERMPKEGKSLNKVQTDLIRDWINQGANWPDGLVLNLKAGDNPPALELVMRPPPEPSAAEIKALADLEASPIRAVPIAVNVGWHEASVGNRGASVNDAALAPISHVSSLIYLNLAGAEVTDAGLPYLRRLTNLTRLHLERTRITDSGLANLEGLTDLAYLNLYSTTITDAGLTNLYGLTNLQTIYLWDTKTTEDGVKRLQTALPKLRISNGSIPNIFFLQAEEKPPVESKGSL